MWEETFSSCCSMAPCGDCWNCVPGLLVVPSPRFLYHRTITDCCFRSRAWYLNTPSPESSNVCCAHVIVILRAAMHYCRCTQTQTTSRRNALIKVVTAQQHTDSKTITKLARHLSVNHPYHTVWLVYFAGEFHCSFLPLLQNQVEGE